MSQRLTAALGAAAAVVLTVGCGSDEQAPIEPIGLSTDAQTTEPATLSKRQFINEADAICSESNVAIAGLSTGTTGDNLELLASQEQQITSGLLDSIDQLGAPEDPTGALTRFTDALGEQVSINRERQRAAVSGDTAAYDALGGELAQAKADALAAAEEYGFSDCGQEGVAPTVPDSTGTSGDTGGVTPAPAPAPAPAPVPIPDTGGGGGGGGDSGDGSTGGISPG